MRTPRRTAVRRGAVALLAAAASLAAAAPASAAPTWLAPVKLSPGEYDVKEPQIAVDQQGDALAVWQHFNGASFVIEASGRAAGGGSWSAPVTISGALEESSVPRVGLDAHGDAVVVWSNYNGSEYSIQASVRSGLAGSWQKPETLAAFGAEPIQRPPELAVNQQGEAVAAWERESKVVEAATRPVGGPWQSAKTLSSTGEIQHPIRVGIDSAGDATAVWEDKGSGEVLIDASTKPAGGNWGKAVALSQPGENANEPRIAVNARGDAIAVWERPEGGNETIQAATRPATSSTWGEPLPLSPTTTREPAEQQVALDASGNAIVVWSWLQGGASDVIEATEGNVNSRAWTTPVVISPLGRVEEESPQVAVDAQGDAVAVWERWNGANNIVEAASGHTGGGPWQTPVALSQAGEEAYVPQVALDAQGDAAAVWARYDGAAYRAEAAGYDAAGPLLNSLSIPASGTAGQALAFSVSPFDIWSALGSTSWSFGDGASQTGASVTHTYAAAGAYTVTVTGSDVLGNTSSASASLTIVHAASLAVAPILPAPRITGASLSHRRFRVSKHPTAVSAAAKPPQGTSFRFTLSELAGLKIAFQRTVRGMRSRKRCVAPTPKLTRAHAKRCTRTVTVGILTRATEPAGADALSFSGRIGQRALAAGAYKAVLTATAHGLTSAPLTLALTVLR